MIENGLPQFSSRSMGNSWKFLITVNLAKARKLIITSGRHPSWPHTKENQFQVPSMQFFYSMKWTCPKPKIIPINLDLCRQAFRQWSTPAICTSCQLEEVEPVDVSYDVQYDGISKGRGQKWDQGYQLLDRTRHVRQCDHAPCREFEFFFYMNWWDKYQLPSVTKDE